jgi:hypothetical protein
MSERGNFGKFINRVIHPVRPTKELCGFIQDALHGHHDEAITNFPKQEVQIKRIRRKDRGEEVRRAKRLTLTAQDGSDRIKVFDISYHKDRSIHVNPRLELFKPRPILEPSTIG